MFCENCGTELSKEAKFCPNCGTKVGKKDDTKKNVKTKKEKQQSNKEKEINETRENMVQEEIRGTEEYERTQEDVIYEELQNQPTKSVGDKVKNAKNQIIWEKQNNSYSKKTLIVCCVVILIFGAVISGITTYYVAAKPVLDMKYEYEAKLEETNKKLEDATKKYREINNIRVDNTTPKETKLQGEATVGVDLAAGTYKISAKDNNWIEVYIHAVGEEGSSYRAYYYYNSLSKSKDIGEVILKAGETISVTGSGIAVFTPEKE